MRSIKKTTPDQNITKDPKHKLSDTPECGLPGEVEERHGLTFAHLPFGPEAKQSGI
jgi:hypothetical protein